MSQSPESPNPPQLIDDINPSRSEDSDIFIESPQFPTTSPPEETPSPEKSLKEIQNVANGIGAHLRRAIIGRDEVIQLVLIALFADGHVLLEDYPGSGKTTLAKALGHAIESNDTNLKTFQRIQFTPDLLPSDITGVSIFSPKEGTFHFAGGPIFSHIVLADEINRTPPKVQAAMLEAMGEKQVTADGKRYPLDELFFVIATQNPLDVTGTYPLPTPQLDRFLFKIQMDYIPPEDELNVLKLHLLKARKTLKPLPKISRQQILITRQKIRQTVNIAPQILDTLVDIANAIRNDDRVLQGISTRSLVVAMPALQTRAALHGRDYVDAEDLRILGPHLFCHRMERAPGSPPAELLYKELSRLPMEKLVQHLLAQH